MAKNTVKKSKPPTVSVVMSIYNGERYLKDSIRSILSQTYKDFEFIIINDGSSDSTEKILNSFRDSRIHIISRQNKGLVFSLNEGIRKARGIFIARQDDDDISHPQRLAREVKFMLNNPKCVLVGTAFKVIDEDNHQLAIEAFPTEDQDLKRAMVSVNPFAHGSTMFTRQAAIDAGLYTDKYGPTEDYALWSKLAKAGEIHNLPKVLYSWRVNMQGISQSQSKKQKIFSKKIARNNFLVYDHKNLSIEKTRDKIEFYKSLDSQYGQHLKVSYLKTCLQYISTLIFMKKYKEALINFINYLKGGKSSLGVLFYYSKGRFFDYIKKRYHDLQT